MSKASKGKQSRKTKRGLGLGKTNTTTNVMVEQPYSYSKVERALVQAGVMKPQDIVSKTNVVKKDN